MIFTSEQACDKLFSVTCLLTSAYVCICLHVFVSALKRVIACLNQTHASFSDHVARLKKP